MKFPDYNRHTKVCIKLIVVFNVSLQLLFTCVSCEDSNYNVTSSRLPHSNKQEESSKIESILLRKCFANNSGGLIKLPVFNTILLQYNLENVSIIQDEPPLVCPEKQTLTSMSDFDVTASIADFDEEYDGEDVGVLFEILRGVSMILQNGYLSVGIDLETAIYYSPNEYCIERVSGEGKDAVAYFRTCSHSKMRPVLRKCCPLGMILTDSTCIGLQDEDEPVWDPQYLDAKTLKSLSLEKVNPVIQSPILPCDEEMREFWDTDYCSYEFHPLTDNRTAFVGAYRTWEFLPSDVNVCFDVLKSENGTRRPIMFHCLGNDTSLQSRNEGKKARISFIYMIAMYVGAFFHFLTTTVYVITWPKQNIHGKTLCSCTFSWLLMQIFLGTAHLLGNFKHVPKLLCILNAIGGHFFMIARFTWLLVVNVDLWRTFRSIRAEGGKSMKRFLAYSGFGWGVPLLISVISISLEFTFTCRVTGVPVPEYGEYYCFVSPWAQGYYIYYIISFLMALSLVFAALTIFGLYSFKKDISNLRSNKQADDKQDFILFFKLSLVMGLTWVFEVISWAVTKEEDENDVVWIIFDLYNALSAILIFIIFVCKRSMMNLLEQSAPAFKGITAAFSKFALTFTRDSYADNTNSTSLASASTSRKDSNVSRRHQQK